MQVPRLRAIGLVARREYLVKARTRSFKIATAFLVVAALAVALAPIVIRLVEGNEGAKIGVRSSATLPFDPASQLGTILNLPSITGSSRAFTFTTVPDEAAARTQVKDGGLSALLLIDRSASGDLAFTIVSKDPLSARTPTLLRAGCQQLAIVDRLERFGLSPEQQAQAFAPPAVTVEPPLPTDKPSGGLADVTSMLVGQALVIFIFVAIILYGQWVAMSVAEEKSSRVMELVINAATPLELLGGKVIGVGALGLTQYAAAVVSAIVALVFQDRIASAVLGSGGGPVDLGSAGLTFPVIVAFGIFFVLGFLLYAVLYAAAGSLVSRMEDVNSVVGPMTMIGMVGYLVAVYSASGLIPLDAPWVVAFSFVPFVSPYLMLSRVIAGQAGALDVTIATVLLVLTILGALWVAARVYAAGVLTYGQKPGPRALFRAAFGRRA